MRYLVIFSYDGTNFSGLQKQPNLRTIESEFEKALYSINNKKETKITSSGRTDKGVHALAQTAHVDISVDITEYKLKRALNSLLPDDIHVISTRIVDKDFHARYMVVEKTYEYILNTGEYSPVDRNKVYQYGKKLDILKMQKAIKSFIGTHDFKPFVSEEGVKENCIRTILKAEIIEDRDLIKITFTGTGFMKYQVRNMVGCLLRIGEGKLPVDFIDQVFSNNDLKKHILTINPEGLYLVSVRY